MRWRTASGMPPGRLWSVAGRQVRVTFGRSRVRATSSRARAPQPTTRTRGAGVLPGAEVVPGASAGRSGRDAGTRATLLDQPARRLGGDPGIAAVGIGADRHPELLVERGAADQHDVVVAH